MSQSNQVYLYNIQAATNALISQSYVSGLGGNGHCDSLAISYDGRFVAYRSFATNLVPGDTNGVADIFLYDQLTGGTTLVSGSLLGNRSANGRSLNPMFSKAMGTRCFSKVGHRTWGRMILIRRAMSLLSHCPPAEQLT